MSKIIVVDTNIIVSALISNHRKIRQTFFNSDLQIAAPKFIIVELFKHSRKIQESAKLSPEELLDVLSSIVNRIAFHDDAFISIGSWIEAFRLCRNVDEKDTPFIALSLELNAELWTNDMELKVGLKKLGFERFMEL